MIDEIDRYRWIDGRQDLDAVSITLAWPADDALIDVLAPRRQLPMPLIYADALNAAFALADFAAGSVLAQLDELQGWIAIIEPCGWAAAPPEVVARLSAHGVAVNVFWNVNADMSACLARDGALVRQFDPLLYDPGDRPLPEERGLPFGDPSALVRRACLAFLARCTGVGIGEAWLLETSRRTFVVPVP
jgi:hypothetical protein